MVELLGALV